MTVQTSSGGGWMQENIYNTRKSKWVSKKTKQPTNKVKMNSGKGQRAQALEIPLWSFWLGLTSQNPGHPRAHTQSTAWLWCRNETKLGRVKFLDEILRCLHSFISLVLVQHSLCVTTWRFIAKECSAGVGSAAWEVGSSRNVCSLQGFATPCAEKSSTLLLLLL